MKPLIDESNFDWVRCTRVSWQGQSNVSSFVNVLIRKSTLLHMKRDMGKMVVIHFFISQHPVYYFRRHLKIDILRFKILDFSIISHCYICQDIQTVQIKEAQEILLREKGENGTNVTNLTLSKVAQTNVPSLHRPLFTVLSFLQIQNILQFIQQLLTKGLLFTVNSNS